MWISTRTSQSYKFSQGMTSNALSALKINGVIIDVVYRAVDVQIYLTLPYTHNAKPETSTN